MTPFQRRLYEKAQCERELVCDWIMELMKQSPQKPTTKETLREIAIQKFKVSKMSFDSGWDLAIIKSGNEHWWRPSPRRNKVTLPKH
jgi:hypothetical protein